MKQPSAYYLLLLYCTVMIRCAMPVACDALSHLFGEEEHIATIHAVYGNHHVQAEIAGTVPDTQGKHTNAQQDEPTVVHTLSSNDGIQHIFAHLIPEQFPLYTYPLCFVFLHCAGEPPESC